MTDSTVDRRGEQARPQGLIATVLGLPLQLFGLLCGSLLLSILIECIGIHWFWPDQGWHHAEALLAFELDQLSSHFAHSILLIEPAQSATHLVKRAFDLIFVESGMLDWAHRTINRSHDPTAAAGPFRAFLGITYSHVETYVLAAGYTALVCLVRVVILFLTLPLFLLAAFVGSVDGLVRRDIRRFSAGRESAFIYHRAKAVLASIFVLPWVIYLSLPLSVHPLLILLPTAVLLGIVANVAAGSFKKYL